MPWRSWWWLRLFSTWFVGCLSDVEEVLVMVKIFPSLNCRGGLDDGWGPFSMGLQRQLNQC
jgi:hypothetical protein